MLHSSGQSDANCSRSTNASKLVIDFLDEPFEKNSDSEVIRMPPQEDFFGETNTPDFFKCKCFVRHFSSFFAQSERS